MKTFIDWLSNNIQLVTSCALIVVNILITIFKKKVKVSNVFTGLLTVLPSYISEAEGTGKDGKEKFTLVFNRAVNYLKLMTGKDDDQIIKAYALLIGNAIENILQTPQKKEN